MYLKILRKSPLSSFKLDDLMHDVNTIQNALLEIEAYNDLIEKIIVDPSVGNFFSIDDTAISHKSGYSSQHIESIIRDFNDTYMI